MGNILNAELYRLKRQKSSWILLPVLFGYTFFTALYSGLLLGNAPFLDSLYTEMKELYSSYGMESMYTQIEQIRAAAGFMSYGDFIASMVGSTAAIFMCAFVYLFSARPQYMGYYKNFLTNSSEGAYLGAETVVILIYGFAVMLVSVLAALPAAFIFCSFDSFGNPLRFAGFFGLMWLMVAAVGFMIMCFTTLAKRPAIGAMFGMLYALILSDLLYQLIDLAAGSASGSSFMIESFTLVGNISIFDYSSNTSFLSGGICALLYGGLWLVLNLVFLRKKDKI